MICSPRILRDPLTKGNIMNIAVQKPESMTIETSRIMSFCDITAEFAFRGEPRMMLDLRLLPMIKIDAIARLYNDKMTSTYVNYATAQRLFSSALFHRYNNTNVKDELVVNAVYPTDMYYVVLDWQLSPATSAMKLFLDLRDFLHKEAGIVLSRNHR